MEVGLPYYCIFCLLPYTIGNSTGKNMPFKRDIDQKCLALIKQYPVLTITGPRQSGKTTLVRELFPDYAYINLEDPQLRELAARDPVSIFNQSDKLIIDEIQNVPELLSHIQVIVDEKQKEGMFILTGSHQVALHEALSQSLAGRTAILELLPLSMNELANEGFELSANELLLTGCYPRIYQKQLNPTKMYADYVKTYLERDVRQMINIKDQIIFQRFLKLCAARTGHILNMNTLANDIGVSNHTIKHWLSILQASFLIKLIPPFYENFGKQVTKSPKLYFADVGLACYLLEIESVSQVDRDPLRGHLFETLVVNELIKTRLNQAREPNLYFYRDSQKNEVDIIYKKGAELIPIEIKSSQTINRDFFKGLDYFRKIVGDRCGDGYLVYAGPKKISLEREVVINFKDTKHII